MLDNDGKIIIYDFYAKNFIKKYKHKKGLFHISGTLKMFFYHYLNTNWYI